MRTKTRFDGFIRTAKSVKLCRYLSLTVIFNYHFYLFSYLYFTEEFNDIELTVLSDNCYRRRIRRAYDTPGFSFLFHKTTYSDNDKCYESQSAKAGADDDADETTATPVPVISTAPIVTVLGG